MNSNKQANEHLTEQSTRLGNYMGPFEFIKKTEIISKTSFYFDCVNFYSFVIHLWKMWIYQKRTGRKQEKANKHTVMTSLHGHTF